MHMANLHRINIGLSFILWLLIFPSFACADTIVLKNGNKIKSERVWEEDGIIKCIRMGGVVGYPKASVERIEKEDKEESVEKEDIEKEENVPSPSRKEEGTSLIEKETCYELGYRYGLCATKSMLNIQCNPENDIVIPPRCRGKEETQRGLKAGVKAVYDTLNLDKGNSKWPSSLDMLTTPLDVLRRELEGKTKTEVRKLVGNPDRIEVFAGKKCWIYGNTYTSRDRGIVFDGERVLTVTFY